MVDKYRSIAIKYESINKLTTEQVEDLIKSLEKIGNLDNLELKNPRNHLETCKVNEWLAWLRNITDGRCDEQIEGEFYKLIETLRENLHMISQRNMDVIRKVLELLDIREEVIKIQREQIDDLEQKLDEKENNKLLRTDNIEESSSIIPTQISNIDQKPIRPKNKIEEVIATERAKHAKLQ
jgi:hypothetical protein